jgi:hypothetical protein
VVFVAAPRLRRHWWVRGYRHVPLGWSWVVAGVIAGFTWYVAESFLLRNPILPTTDDQLQYIDLSFQLSIAGETTHNFPVNVPQVAGEPLHYHWFVFAHMGAASLISGVDLPVVFFRLAVPALCALAAVLIAVAGWRLSGRPLVGATAAVLLFTIGEFGFENGVRQLFGTQATFIVWGSPSMTYSWVLLIPLIVAAGDRIGRARDGVPELGPGAYAVAALLMLGSTGAKASSVPVIAAAAAFTTVVLLLFRLRPVWPAIVVTGIAVLGQAFATVVLFAFSSHGVTVDPFSGLKPYVEPGSAVGWTMAMVALLLNMQLRLAGIPALLWLRRGRLEPVQIFLLGGALAGPAIYLLFGHPGSSNQYFVRSAFAFGVLLSAWGYAMVLDRARPSRPALVALAVGGAVFALALIGVQLRNAPATFTVPPADGPLHALVTWAALLAMAAAIAGLVWHLLGGRWPELRGKGGAILLTGVLLAGAPGLVMDARAARAAPNGGAYVNVPVPAYRIDVARYVHEHSEPDDIVATNAHCRAIIDGWCDSRTFWLSAYTERSVLIEGWAFAPRAVTLGISPFGPFWDQPLFQLNEAAFYAPTAEVLAQLRDRGVRWLVVDREAGTEAPGLASLAERRLDNGRVAVYEIR